MSVIPQSIAYKESGVQWLGKIPAHWEVTTIRACFEESDARCGNKQYPLLSVTQEQGIVLQEHITTKKDVSNDDKSNYKIVPLGGIAYNKMRMWQGAVGLNEIEAGIVSPAYVVVIPKQRISSKFSFYLFKTPSMIEEFGRYSYGLCSDMNTLRYEDFHNISIPLPPLKEQQAIADFLDKKTRQIEEFTTKKQKLITLLEEKKQTLINQCVTQGLDPSTPLKDSGVEWIGKIPTHWEVRKLKYVVSLRNQKEGESDFRIGLENIESKTGRFIQANESAFDDEGIGFFEGDVLFGKLRPYLAKVFLADKNGICVSEFLVLKSEGILNRFLKFLMLSGVFIEVVNSSTYGTKMPRANWEFIGNLKIPIPPLEEQKTIAEYLDTQIEKIDLAICKIKSQINLIKEYKATLISEAVCGRAK